MADKSLGLALLFMLGIGAQWIAWRVRLPSILLLLCAGFLAGPWLGWLDPDELLGARLIEPIVALSVPVILFEGGLPLHPRELRGRIGRVVRNLVSLGMVFTWFAVAGAAMWIFDLPGGLALLLGAALSISGPTVVGPMLQHMRPIGPVGAILKWEGIAIDPIGAMVATLVFRSLQGHPDLADAAARGALTVLSGGLLGLLRAGLMVVVLARGWIPDRLEIALTLTTVLAVTVASNGLQAESGLLASTVMGIALANQRHVGIKSTLRFKENLVVLLISLLFVLLAARLDRTTLLALLDWRSAAFLALVVLAIRPVAVLLSTLGSSLHWREKLFLACMSPRGIVAASVVPLFALHFAEAGERRGTEEMVSITFLTIIGTVAVSGLAAPRIARRLGLAQADPQGVLILGASSIGIAIARALKELEVRALLVDTNWSNVRAARLEGLEAVHANLLEGRPEQDLDLGGIGKPLAVVPNEEVNTLAAIEFSELFGKRNVFKLPRNHENGAGEPDAALTHRRIAFDTGADFGALRQRLESGQRMKATRITAEFGLEDFLARHGPEPLLMFVKEAHGRLLVVSAKERPKVEAGDTVVALVRPTTPKRAEGAAADRGVAVES